MHPKKVTKTVKVKKLKTKNKPTSRPALITAAVVAATGLLCGAFWLHAAQPSAEAPHDIQQHELSGRLQHDYPVQRQDPDTLPHIPEEPTHAETRRISAPSATRPSIAAPNAPSPQPPRVIDLVEDVFRLHRQMLQDSQLLTSYQDKLATLQSHARPETYSAVSATLAYLSDISQQNHLVPPGPASGSPLIMILGHALAPDGQMTSILTGRLEKALATAAQFDNPTFLVTGGVPRGGTTEAEQMQQWLIDNGIAESRIIVEQASGTTIENMRFSLPIITSRGFTNIVLVTSDFHTIRAQTLLFLTAQINGVSLNVRAAPSSTGQVENPNLLYDGLVVILQDAGLLD
ncbi:YdcF family protein [Candidatus Saccharibacteria bacterium]|nr:YdcF family protein [Candidatus Saccharibacteria bacterium]